ncbi:MAG: hypothetical protein V4857_05345 [Pseudomonadota bacterium]
MNTELTNVSKLLEILESELELSGNIAFEYIELLHRKLQSSKTTEDITTLLLQIKSSGKVVDFANFTSEQEEIWNEIWREATRLLRDS